MLYILGQLLFIAVVFAVVAFARQLARRIGMSQPLCAIRSVAAF